MRLSLFQRLSRTRVYAPGLTKTLPKRVDWEQIEGRPRQEGTNVVKGTSKRVVVVKSPDPRVFEQAIFIVREDFLARRRDGAGEILREAQAVADRYVRAAVNPPGLRRFPRVPLALWLGLGAVAVAAVAAVFLFHLV